MYCKTWKLIVDPTKTKSAVCNSKVNAIPDFTYGKQVINNEYDFNYLEKRFDYEGQFYKARIKCMVQARKALFAVIKKSCK